MLWRMVQEYELWDGLNVCVFLEFFLPSTFKVKKRDGLLRTQHERGWHQVCRTIIVYFNKDCYIQAKIQAWGPQQQEAGATGGPGLKVKEWNWVTCWFTCSNRE